MKKLIWVLIAGLVLVLGCAQTAKPESKSGSEKPVVEPSSQEKSVEESSADKRIKELIKQLGDNDWKKREKTTTELFNIGKPALPFLEEAHRQTTDAEIRLRAGILIKIINRKSLIEALKDRDKEVRSCAAKALANMGKSAVDDLIPHLKDPNANFRKEIRKVLVMIGRSAMSQLITALSEKNDTLRIELFRALAEISDPLALSDMREVLRQYPCWDGPERKRKNRMYVILEGYYQDLRFK